MSTYLFRILILLPLCSLLGCRQNSNNKADDIVVIDVINNIGKYQDIFISEFVSELEYIPLETSENCLIAGVRSILVTPTHIFAQIHLSVGGSVILPGATRCYAFDRNGRFLCEIGRVGQGPGEYQSILGLFIDEKSQLLYIETHRTLLEYSYDGVFRRSIRKPQNKNEFPIREVMFVRDNLFIGHSPNYRGNEPYNFVLFNDSGRIIKTFDNHIKFEQTNDGFSTTDQSMPPFRVSEYIYVKEYSNDTLYCLNEQNELIPQFVYDLGKYTYSKEKRVRVRSLNGMRVAMKDVLTVPAGPYYMNRISESIFFSISGELDTNIPTPKGKTVRRPNGMEEQMRQTPVGIYDIVNKKTRLLETDPISRRVGLINDIDGGMSFWPKYYSSANELIDFYQVYDMKEILTEQYFAGHEIKNSQAHQKLRELLKNLDWEDNPVIVITKLKK